jgi:hypothetical protein
MPERILSIENKMGRSYRVGDMRITPFSRVWRFQPPGFNGGLIWNRPLSILVKTGNGEEQVLPVTDVTRQAQWGILGLAAGILLLTWLLKRTFTA